VAMTPINRMTPACFPAEVQFFDCGFARKSYFSGRRRRGHSSFRGWHKAAS
jgi:hypothetical protein